MRAVAIAAAVVLSGGGCDKLFSIDEIADAGGGPGDARPADAPPDARHAACFHEPFTGPSLTADFQFTNPRNNVSLTATQLQIDTPAGAAAGTFQGAYTDGFSLVNRTVTVKMDHATTVTGYETDIILSGDTTTDGYILYFTGGQAYLDTVVGGVDTEVQIGAFSASSTPYLRFVNDGTTDSAIAIENSADGNAWTPLIKSSGVSLTNIDLDLKAGTGSPTIGTAPDVALFDDARLTGANCP